MRSQPSLADGTRPYRFAKNEHACLRGRGGRAGSKLSLHPRSRRLKPAVNQDPNVAPRPPPTPFLQAVRGASSRTKRQAGDDLSVLRLRAADAGARGARCGAGDSHRGRTDRLAARGLGVAVTTLAARTAGPPSTGRRVSAPPTARSAEASRCCRSRRTPRDSSGVLVASRSTRPTPTSGSAIGSRLWFVQRSQAHRQGQRDGRRVRPVLDLRCAHRQRIGPQRRLLLLRDEEVHDGRGRRDRHAHAAGASTRAGNRVKAATTSTTTSSSGASKGLPAELVAQFSTFHTQQLVPYAPPVISRAGAPRRRGRSAERTRKARDKMMKSQEANCARDVPATRTASERQQPLLPGDVQHVLLPSGSPLSLQTRSPLPGERPDR